MRKLVVTFIVFCALFIPSVAYGFNVTSILSCQPGQAGYIHVYSEYLSTTSAQVNYYNYLTGGHWSKFAGTTRCTNVFGCLNLGYAKIEPYPWRVQSFSVTSTHPVSITKKWCQWFG